MERDGSETEIRRYVELGRKATTPYHSELAALLVATLTALIVLGVWLVIYT